MISASNLALITVGCSFSVLVYGGILRLVETWDNDFISSMKEIRDLLSWLTFRHQVFARWKDNKYSSLFFSVLTWMRFLCDVLIQTFHWGESYLLHNPDVFFLLILVALIFQILLESSLPLFRFWWENSSKVTLILVVSLSIYFVNKNVTWCILYFVLGC